MRPFKRRRLFKLLSCFTAILCLITSCKREPAASNEEQSKQRLLKDPSLHGTEQIHDKRSIAYDAGSACQG
jgi:hypothetical protein